MLKYITIENFGLLLSVISLCFSFIALRLHAKNKKISEFSAKLNFTDKKIQEPYLTQIDRKDYYDPNYVHIHLAFFNPSAVKALIYSLTVYKQERYDKFGLKYLGLICWKEQNNTQWWPTNNPVDETPKLLKNEYKNILVKDVRDISVKLNSVLDRAIYKFELKTNFGNHICETSIDGYDAKFSHNHISLQKELKF